MNSNTINLSHKTKLNDLKIGTLNVCGIKNRVNFPDFVELISKYDVYCCTECKIDSYDEICIDNYTFLKQPRKQALCDDLVG